MKFHSIRDVSVQVGFSTDGLHRLIRSGKLAAIQPAGPKGKYLVPESELERLLTTVSPARDQK